MKTTRLQVAEYLANNLSNDRAAAVNQAAAWLVSSGQVRDMEYLVRDATTIAKDNGYLYAVVTSAHELSTTTKHEIERYLTSATGAKQLELEYHLDASLLGGIRLELPDSELDNTVTTKLNRFAAGTTS